MTVVPLATFLIGKLSVKHEKKRHQTSGWLSFQGRGMGLTARDTATGAAACGLQILDGSAMFSHTLGVCDAESCRRPSG